MRQISGKIESLCPIPTQAEVSAKLQAYGRLKICVAHSVAEISIANGLQGFGIERSAGGQICLESRFKVKHKIQGSSCDTRTNAHIRPYFYASAQRAADLDRGIVCGGTQQAAVSIDAASGSIPAFCISAQPQVKVRVEGDFSLGLYNKDSVDGRRHRYHASDHNRDCG